MKGLCHNCLSSNVDVSLDAHTGFVICNTCQNNGGEIN